MGPKPQRLLLPSPAAAGADVDDEPPHPHPRGGVLLSAHCDLPRLLTRESCLEVWALVFDMDLQLLCTLTPSSPPAPFLQLHTHRVADNPAPSQGPGQGQPTNEVVLARLWPAKLPPRALAIALTVRRGEVCTPPSAMAMAAQAADAALVGMRHLRTRAGKGVRCRLLSMGQGWDTTGEAGKGEGQQGKEREAQGPTQVSSICSIQTMPCRMMDAIARQCLEKTVAE